MMPSSRLPPPKLGYVPISHSFQSYNNEWSLDRLLKSNGIIAIVVGSLIFLVVYSWVDAFAQLYREYVTDPPIYYSKLPQKHSTSLNAKWKFVYAILLTIATTLISYLLLFIWKRFD